MIKRKSANFLILLANILLFAALVIPHHHHSSTICFKFNHCTNDDIKGKQSEPNHRHDGTSDSCGLVINILPSSDKGSYTLSNLSDTHSCGLVKQDCLLQNNKESFNTSFILFDPPWVKSLYINSLSGKRAPPAV